MHRHVYAIALLALLCSALPAFGQGPQGLYFPGTQQGTGSNSFTNIHVGPGSVSMIGGSGNGTDQVTNLNVNGVQNVMAWGAACDGATDDTAALNAAHTAANNGGTVLIPPNKTCNVTQLDWHDSTRTLIYGVGATLHFTGAGLNSGVACSANTGGLWRLGGTGTGFDRIFGLTITSTLPTTGSVTNCVLNTSSADSDGPDEENVQLTQVTASGGPNIFWWSHRVTTLMLDHSTIYNPQAVYANVGSSWDGDPLLVEDNILQGGGAGGGFTNQWGTAIVTVDGWTQGTVIDRNRFEQCLGGDCVIVALLYGGSVSHNTMMDAFGTRPWAAGTAQPANTCVIPKGAGADPAYVADTTGNSTYTFCTTAGGTTGATEPNWTSVPIGGTINDGTTGAVLWRNIGRGISFWVQQLNGGNIDGNSVAGWATNVWVGLIGSFTGVDNGGEVTGNASGTYFNIVDNAPNITSRSNFMQTNANPGGPAPGGVGGYAFYAFANASGFVSQQEICSSYGSYGIKWTAAPGARGILLGTDQNPGGGCGFNYSNQNVNWVDSRWPHSPTAGGLQIYYSAATTPLVGCGPANARTYACVTDALNCTAGAIYNPGAGAQGCQVQCKNDGSAWVTTGQACY